MNPYVLLGCSILFEVFADTCMKLSNGFKQKVYVIGVVIGYVISFVALSRCCCLCRWECPMRFGRVRPSP